MLLPAMQHGEWKDVRARVKSSVRRIKRGEGLTSAMLDGGMLDTDTTDGVLVVSGTLRPGLTGFYFYEPWKHLLDEISKLDDDVGLPLEEKIFQESLTVPWGVLGLMSPSNTLWFSGHRDWEKPVMDAALKVWDEIDGIGPRYITSFQPQRMWDVPNSLKHVLARAGVPNEVLRAPLPKGGPAALLKYAKIAS